MQIHVLFIGFGAVATCVSVLWRKVIPGIHISNSVIIEPRDIENPPTDFPYQQIQKALTKANYAKVLDKALEVLEEIDIIIDLSVFVEAMDIIDWAYKHGIKYVNTSVEDWKGSKWNGSFDTMLDRTIYYKHEILLRKYKGKFPTIGIELGGQNPGCVSHFVKYALARLARKHKIKSKSFGQIAKQLELETIHISEIDTTKTKKKRPHNTFWNTWSCVGFYTEASDPVQVGFGTHETTNIPGVDRVMLRKYMAFLPIRGMDTLAKSYVPLSMKTGKEIKGFMIPHGEASSISRYLEVKSGDRVTYRPSCYYVYQSSKTSIDSMEDIKLNGYNMLPDWYVLKAEDIESGVDAVGTLLLFRELPAIWIGSILDHKEAKRYSPVINATTVQVAANMLASIAYILQKAPNAGLVFAEDLDSEWILRRAKPFLGKFIMRYVPFRNPDGNRIADLLC